MPLVAKDLADKLYAAAKKIADNKDANASPEDIMKAKAQADAEAIMEFIKSANVTVAAGIAVNTTGSAAAQAGATVATGTATIT